MPRVAAIYRLLYGSDFIAESLEAIYPHVDHILCFVGRRPFGGRDRVRYFGHDVYFPHDIDGLRDTIARWAEANDTRGKLEIIDNPFDAQLKNQMGAVIDRFVLPRYDLSHVMMVEADEVWRDDLLAASIDLLDATDADEFMATGSLFWRSPRYVSRRDNPYAVFRRVEGLASVGTLGHALMSTDSGLRRASAECLHVHNFGYAASARTTFWKHMTALSFSRDCKLDSVPREDWFENVWLPWNWHTNRDPHICPARNYPDAFAPPVEHAFEHLPRPIRRRLLRDPLPEWAQAESVVQTTTDPAARAASFREAS